MLVGAQTKYRSELGEASSSPSDFAQGMNNTYIHTITLNFNIFKGIITHINIYSISFSKLALNVVGGLLACQNNCSAYFELTDASDTKAIRCIFEEVRFEFKTITPV